MKKMLRNLCGILAACLMLTMSPWTNIRSFAENDGGSAEPTDENISAADSAALNLPVARAALQELLRDREIMALVYLTDKYEVRLVPDEASSVVAVVPSGQLVLIQDVALDEYGAPWMEVLFSCEDREYTGYIDRYYLASADERFLAWESQYGMNPYIGQTLYSARAAYEDISQFPESYQTALRIIKNAHPNWIFVKQNTNLDWNVVVDQEMRDARNLIPSSYPEAMKNGSYSSGWAYVSAGALKYYLDPRNALTEQLIFQFEQLTYNESYHEERAVQNFLKDSFMAGNVPGQGTTYSQTFWNIGRQLGVSPSHLACRVYQEQGRSGGSPLISGNYPGYEGYYNYFNIGASGDTQEQVIRNGLQKAKDSGWNSVYASILGGARVISQNYILKGQDTLYLQKFDVDGSYNGLYWHQYMQNICAPSSEGSNMCKLYREAGALGNAFVFKIPVYNNMPALACPNPAQTVVSDRVDPVAYTVVGTIGGRNVTFTSPTRDAVIYYSSTTSNITTSDKCVMNGETVLFEDFYGTIYSRAYCNGKWSNVARLILRIPVVNTPEITQSGSAVTIRTTTPDSIIYYTVDGSEPSPGHGTKINSSSVSFSMGSGGTVKAIAVRSCFTNSSVATAQIKSTVDGSITPSSFEVKGVIGGRSVTFNSPIAGAKVYYSTSSSMSSIGSYVRAGESVTFNNFYGTIYARTYANGQWSNVSRLILKIPTVNKPVITSAGEGRVKISTTTPDSIIYFTLDGSTPSPTNGKRINASSSIVTIGDARIVRAIAVRSCFSNSDEVIWQ